MISCHLVRTMTSFCYSNAQRPSSIHFRHTPFPFRSSAFIPAKEDAIPNRKSRHLPPIGRSATRPDRLAMDTSLRSCETCSSRHSPR
jgi:hypothetical protein